jgi:hypothetical protein
MHGPTDCRSAAASAANDLQNSKDLARSGRLERRVGRVARGGALSRDHRCVDTVYATAHTSTLK